MNPPDGEERIETSFFRKLWEDLWLNLPGLLTANLLFLLWCAPSVAAALLSLHGVAVAIALVTVGPALLGLFRYAAGIVLDRPCSVWRASVWGFRSGFRAGVIAIAMAMGALAAGPVLVTATPGAPVLAMAIRMAYAGFLILLALVGLHALGMTGLYQQGIRDAIRNATLLTLAHPAPALGLLGVGVITAVLIRVLGGGPLIILPSLFVVLQVSTTFLLVQQHQALSEGHHGSERHGRTVDAG